ncbi:MAG: BlaI/MecI/CopY family transcriptional regulator [Acidobacteriia bacterium]|nr:BlaI/MecI/CopY family transcriptional regulator [Terriglobia bacterium]
MRTPPAEKLSRREREIMNALFALANKATAEDIRARLSDPPSYSAVRAMLVRLEHKGYLRHQEDGVRYVYSATTSHAAARRAALQQYLRVFFDGSLGQMMTALVRQEAWTDEELDSLRTEIDRVRKGRKQS